MILTVMLSPLARAAQQDEWALVAYGERKKGGIPSREFDHSKNRIATKSSDQREAIGKEFMNGEKSSKLVKGYQCIPYLP